MTFTLFFFFNSTDCHMSSGSRCEVFGLNDTHLNLNEVENIDTLVWVLT